MNKEESDMARYDYEPGRRGEPADQERLGRGWLLLPMVCCGGPLVLVALVTLGALAWVVMGGLVALAVGAVVMMRRRAARSCCPPAGAQVPNRASVRWPGESSR